MSEEFIYYTSNFNERNYNKMINKPDIDSFNENKKIAPFSYNL